MAWCLVKKKYRGNFIIAFTLCAFLYACQRFWIQARECSYYLLLIQCKAKAAFLLTNFFHVVRYVIPVRIWWEFWTKALLFRNRHSVPSFTTQMIHVGQSLMQTVSIANEVIVVVTDRRDSFWIVNITDNKSTAPNIQFGNCRKVCYVDLAKPLTSVWK
jgi:hypothetical protein